MITFRSLCFFRPDRPDLMEIEESPKGNNFQVLEENPFQKSGFILVNESTQAYMYYVFFNAINNNENASTILWLQGGPGCSSMTGLFEEMGPYKVNKDLLLEKRDNTWNENYNMLFVDNPCGAGFSYVKDKEGYVSDQEEMANELYTFLERFFSLADFSYLKSNKFFVFGESYGGKFAPTIAHKIASKGFKLPLNGVIIGDGASEPSVQMTNYTPFLKSNSLLGNSDIQIVKEMEKSIKQMIEKEEWKLAITTVENMHDYITTMAGNVSIYDIRTYEEYDFSRTVKYLNFPHVKKMMHTEGIEYSGCSPNVYHSMHEDMMKSTVVPKIIELLNVNISITYYSGQFDLIVFAEGTKKMLEGFKWKYQNDFKNAKRRVWKIEKSKKIGGYVREFENLREIIIPGAGHMSPMDQIERTHEMVRRIIDNIGFI